MGTAAAVTAIVKPTAAVAGGQTYMGVFSLALDATDATGIQTVDLTDYFKYVDAVIVGDNDTLADNGYKAQAICPARTTALTATNVSISFHQSAGSAAAMAAVTSTDLSDIGALKIVVYGRKAV
jgi:hypothetical protein